MGETDRQTYGLVDSLDRNRNRDKDGKRERERERGRERERDFQKYQTVRTVLEIEI